jgi:hypothetical protein
MNARSSPTTIELALARATRLARVPALVLTVGTAGCEADPDDPVIEEFIALQHDFEGFPGWEHESLGFAETTPGHPGGQRTVYVNERPPADADELPLGTIIVKTMETDDFGLLVLAMAKRGAGYNEDGAVGWEWFELALDDAGHPVIVWRGKDPPDGECYGCLPGTESMIEPTSCNDCHVQAADRDFVYTPLAD